jgi:RES domain-containing protein
VAYGRSVRRGGACNRLAEPHWQDPLDTSFSRQHGGRWNAPGSFGVLYLNMTERMARLQVEHKLAGHPYDIEDLDPAAQHDLVEVDVATTDALDLVSAEGLDAVGLPVTYPLDADGRPVPHEQCHTVGRAAYDEPLPAIAYRSAAAAAADTDEELAIFDRAVDLVRQTARRAFADWYLGQPVETDESNALRRS